MEARGRRSDPEQVDRKVLWICMLAGSTIGGYLPTLIGYSSFGTVSLLCSGIGGVARVVAAAQIGAALELTLPPGQLQTAAPRPRRGGEAGSARGGGGTRAQ